MRAARFTSISSSSHSATDQLEGDGSLTVIEKRGTWGNCACGGRVVYYSDYGVRCDKCNKLYGTWVENLRKAKEEEDERRAHIARLIEIKKFENETLI